MKREEKKKVFVKYLMPDNKEFSYSGYITKQDDHFIYFVDDKEGEIRLVLSRIIIIKEFKDGQ
jgi:hypothetical protein